MTRQEFRDDVCDWSDLISFCSDIGCSITDDIYDDDGRNGYINEQLYSYYRDGNWEGARDYLKDLDDSDYYGYWRLDDYEDWRYLDGDDFDNYKSDVEEYCVENGEFDDDDTENESGFDDPEYTENDAYTFEEPLPVEVSTAPDEDVNFADLIIASSNAMASCTVDLSKRADTDETNDGQEELEWIPLF